MQPVEKIIRRRQWLYHGLLLTTLGFLCSPLLLGCLQGEQCTSTNGLLDPLLAMAMTVLPDFSAPWINVLRDSPKLLYSLLLLFGLLSVMKAKAWTETQHLATKAWATLNSYEQRSVQPEEYLAREEEEKPFAS